ncbi:MAG: hypothetical protein LAO18_07605 [Acidobacteriia bacterium]|jgi:hypothetical protein|nr:hypothetical protein [Terriglobia bacterium]
MVSTLTILFASLLSLFLVWVVLRPGLPPIKSLEDWEGKKHDVDPEVFRVLLDPSQEKYLQQSLPPGEFRLYQRKRLVLALRLLDLVGENTAMLLKLGQLARTEANSHLANEAEELIYGALWLRVNLLLVRPCLWLKWLFPGWALSLPAVEMPYAELLAYLNRIRQQRQWDLQQALMAG